MTNGFAVAALILVTASVIVSSDAAKKLHTLFDEDWQWQLENYPEAATLLGVNRYNDRLTDLSIEAIERRKAHQRQMLRQIQEINRSELVGQDVISYDLFLFDKKIAVEAERFPIELMPISQMEGIHLSFPQLVALTPFRNAKDYRDYLSRLAVYPKQIDQVIELMKRGIERGWTQAAEPLRSVPSQIEGQMSDDPTKSPLYKPFTAFPTDMPETERTRFSAEARKQLRELVMPALKRLDQFIKQTYLPAARHAIAASSLPDGPAFYRHMVRRHTTTDLKPEQIHEIGKREVARIRSQMEQIIKQVDFKGSFRDFLNWLRSDPRFYYTNAEELVAGYALIAKRADGELPKQFAELPRNPYGIRVIPDYEAPAQTTAYYQPGAPDATRAGFFMVNTYKLDTRPKYEMEALTLHEAVPGHHLQISRAQELKGLPDFRRNASYTAYVEGWALYAESLGAEMGFYTDPYSRFGQLTYEMWRACRLVVDTGMHALGWSRQQAIDFMKENTAKTENDIVVEVDRYIVWPAQALAYKIGELKIKELRARAKGELGSKFDVRTFHNAVLDDGPLPLDVLDKRISEWISKQKGK
jgi:uncharacterized protein (DUF885 family)